MMKGPKRGRAQILCLMLAALFVSPALAASDRAPVSLPVEIHSGHVIVEAYVNDQGPFHFIFDSGALNVLTPDAARRLGVKVGGEVEATGTGGVQAGGVARVKAVRIGPLTLANQTFYVLDLPPGTSDDAPVDGLIGWEWLNQYPTRFDYADATLTFFPDGAVSTASKATPFAISFLGRRPQIDGKIDGLPGKFTLDTGSAGSVTLASHFVASHDLIAKYQAKTQVVSAMGIGGPVYALLARAEKLELGGVSVAAPVIFLSQQTNGTSAAKNVTGNIGFGVLHKFTVTFDYPHAQIYLEPNRLWGEPDLADRSGLRLVRAADGFKVLFVVENSPAARAGLKVGDVLLKVDGVSCASLSGEKLKAMLKGPVGATINLTLAGGSTDVTLTLADL